MWQQFQQGQQNDCHSALLNGYSSSSYISQKDHCRVAWLISLCGLSLQMMWVNLGVKKLELILGPSCTSEEHICVELIGQLTGHFHYWGSFVRLVLLLIYHISSAWELLILLHCLSLCGFILYFPWPIMTYQAVNTYNETWAAFFSGRAANRTQFTEFPDPVSFIKVWGDNSNQHLTWSCCHMKLKIHKKSSQQLRVGFETMTRGCQRNGKVKSLQKQNRRSEESPGTEYYKSFSNWQLIFQINSRRICNRV